VEVVLEELKKNPLPRHQRPAFPNYHKAAKRSAKPEGRATRP
jgi:hypothetical protein